MEDDDGCSLEDGASDTIDIQCSSIGSEDDDRKLQLMQDSGAD